MFNSIFLMFSQGNRNKKLANTFKIVWILYSLFTSLLSENLYFFVVNAIAFVVVTEIISFTSRCFPKLNSIFSVVSIMIYSFVVDSICYFGLPIYSGDKTFIAYVTSGFLFNYRFLLINSCVILVVGMILKCSVYLKNYLRVQQSKLVDGR